LYAARDIVSRELTGLIPAVTIDASSERAALNQVVRVHVVPPMTSSTITPAMIPPTPNGLTIGFVDMSITKAESVLIPWSGEEQQSVDANGPGIDNIVRDEVAQAMRTIANKVEADLAGLFVNASRAVSAPANGPFSGTDLGDSAKVRKILDDNGAPLFDRQLVINTNAGVNLRTQTQLTKANEAATDATLRRGTLLDLHGFAIRESAQIGSVTKGTGTLYTSSAAGFPIGTTSIPIITGSGTVLAGDRVTFAGDSNVYIVATGVAAPGTIVLNAPGLRQAIPASATAMTIGASNANNLAFQRSALVLLARAPFLPGGKDGAVDRQVLTDPNTGISFTVAHYMGYHAQALEVSLAWGVKGIKPEHTAVLLGAAN
jgi:hypothetical protein